MSHPKKMDTDVGMITKSATSVRSQLTVIHRTSYFETMIHYLKGNVGSGLFAMGDAVKNAGLLLGCLGTLFLGLVCLYNDHILVRSGIVVRRKLNLIADPNFPETIEYSFICGPDLFRRFSNVARVMVKTSIIVTQFGFCSVYFIFVSSTFHTVMQIHGYDYDLKIYMCIIFLPILLSSLIRTIKFLTPVSLMANLILLIGVALTYYICSINLPSINERRLITNDITTIPLFFGTTIYAFEGISLVIPLRNEMADTSLFTKPFGVLNVGQLLVIFMSASMGSIAYLKYGDSVEGSVTLNLDQGLLSEIVMSTVAIAILLTYAIQFHVAIDILWWDLVAARGPFNHMVLYESLIRTFFVIITFTMAVLIPHLNLFISLIGAMCSTSLALIFPALSDISLRTCPESKDPLRARNKCFQFFCYLMDGLTLILALVGFATGTYFSLSAIVEAMT